MRQENWKIQELKEEAQFAIALLSGELNEALYENVARDCDCTLDDYIQNRFENAIAEFPAASKLWREKARDYQSAMERWEFYQELIGLINEVLNSL